MYKNLKSVLFILVLTTIFSCSENDDLVNNEQTKSIFEELALEEISKSKGLEKENLDVITLFVMGFEVPVVISKVNSDIYPVLIDSNREVKVVLRQEIIFHENGFKTFRHYANNNYIGDYKKNQDNELIEFLGYPANEPSITSFSDCEANEGESCAGCHYRQMKEIIAQDGDAQATCDALNAMGGLCDAEVYISATVHCWLSHDEPEIEQN